MVGPATDRLDLPGLPSHSYPACEADPYQWPHHGRIDPAATALLMIDWQYDFCSTGGYVDRMGYDIERLRRAIPAAARVLEAARTVGLLVIHTREGHRPDLLDLPETKRWRSRRMGSEIGTSDGNGRRLVRGEAGWQIIEELAPRPGEPVIDKPGKGSFYATDLEAILRKRRITDLVFTGVTTDVCVHTTMREANDRGFDNLVVSDATAAVDEDNYQAALKMVTMSGGVFGAVAASQALLASLGSFGRMPIPGPGSVPG